MKAYAESLGVVPNDILVENRSAHTLGNAYFAKLLFCTPNNWHDIIVIASDETMPRLKYLFKKVFGSNYHFNFEVRLLGAAKDIFIF